MRQAIDANTRLSGLVHATIQGVGDVSLGWSCNQPVGILLRNALAYLTRRGSVSSKPTADWADIQWDEANRELTARYTGS